MLNENIHLVAITGGPCGGKTTAMNYLVEELSSRGYKTLIAPEAATKLITSGIVPGKTVDILTFQSLVLKEQLHNEQLMLDAARFYADDYKAVIILCDRGIPDQMAYVTREEFKTVLKNTDPELTLAECYGRYATAIHLVTAADGAIEHYEWAGSDNTEGVNMARSEDPELAVKVDRKTQNAWVGCEHHRIIDNGTDFDHKLKRVLASVLSAIGDPTPLEIERKFLIPMPSEDDLAKLDFTSKSQIVQTYLKSESPFIERRIRQRGSESEGYRFYYTEKKQIGYATWEEREKHLSMREYIELLAQSDPNKHQITKSRYCFLHRGHYFELDIYPFADDVAVLEVEVNDINEDIALPMLSPIREVTGDDRYKNHTIARTLTIPA